MKAQEYFKLNSFNKRVLYFKSLIICIQNAFSSSVYFCVKSKIFKYFCIVFNTDRFSTHNFLKKNFSNRFS